MLFVIYWFCAANALYRLYHVFRSLKNREWGHDILAVLAIISTLLVGELYASLMVVVMTFTGEAIEYYAGNRAKAELKTLKAAQPSVAHFIADFSKKTAEEISITQIKTGDILLIKPGEITPTDGTLIEGIAHFDESSITGEATPITKGAGSQIISGTKNSNTSFYMQATSSAENSEYQKIIDLVANALNQKPKLVSLAAKYSVYFTVISLLIAAVAFFLTGNPDRIAEVLVLATPCPLLIAAPVAFLGGINAGAKKGIIFKNSNAIQAIAEIKTVAFDKTGTLTLGKPYLETAEGDLTHLPYAAALEKYSSHPLAKAFSEIETDLQVSDVKETPGEGISGIVAGKKVAIKKGVSKLGIASQVSVEGENVLKLFFSDQLKSDTPETISHLKKDGVQNISLLTGDNEIAAQKVADEIGITSIYANLLPEDKVAVVQKLQPKPVAFVGDGVNDSPVLASANLGIAISKGNLSAAAESADIVIGGSHLSDLTNAFHIGKRTLKIAKQSIIGGISLSVIAMIFAGFGFIPAFIGALGQEVIDIFAIVNGLRAIKS